MGFVKFFDVQTSFVLICRHSVHKIMIIFAKCTIIYEAQNFTPNTHIHAELLRECCSSVTYVNTYIQPRIASLFAVRTIASCIKFIRILGNLVDFRSRNKTTQIYDLLSFTHWISTCQDGGEQRRGEEEVNLNHLNWPETTTKEWKETPWHLALCFIKICLKSWQINKQTCEKKISNCVRVWMCVCVSSTMYSFDSWKCTDPDEWIRFGGNVLQWSRSERSRRYF